MVNVAKVTTKLAKKQRKLQIAIAAGKVKKADRLRGQIVKLQLKLAKAQAKRGVTIPGAAAPLPGIPGVPGVAKPRRQYTVWLEKGRIVFMTNPGGTRTLGYTAAKAKKLYKTRRRRKRITQRDRLIIAAISQNPQAALALSGML